MTDNVHPLRMATVERLPVPGETWTVHSKHDRSRRHMAAEQGQTLDHIDLYGPQSTRRVVAVADGLVAYWETYKGSGGPLPGVKTVWEFVEQCRAPEEPKPA